MGLLIVDVESKLSVDSLGEDDETSRYIFALGLAFFGLEVAAHTYTYIVVSRKCSVANL